MRTLHEREPQLQHPHGVEEVTINFKSSAQVAASVVAPLAEFSRNYGSLRISPGRPDVRIGLVQEPPHPQDELISAEPWDLIMQPESGLQASEAATLFKEHRLLDTRLIFPLDGVVLSKEGFSTLLAIPETLGRAVQEQLPRRSRNLRWTHPTGLRGIVSNTIVQRLNNQIGELPQSSCFARDIVLQRTLGSRPPLRMSAADRLIFRECIRSTS